MGFGTKTVVSNEKAEQENTSVTKRVVPKKLWRGVYILLFREPVAAWVLQTRG